MKTYLFVVFLTVIQIPIVYCQDWTWGIKATGDQQQDLGADVASDSEGNLAVAGYFKKSFELGTFSLHTDNDSYASIYLSRINSTHQVEWLLRIEAGESYGDDIALVMDDDGNIYLTGNKDSHIFVSKYSSTGKLIWNNDFEKKHYGYGNTIAIDQFDNVYVGGGSGWTFFMAKLNYEGEVVWKKDFWYNYSAACNLSDLNVDALGNIYFVGAYGIDIQLDDFSLIHPGNLDDATFWGRMDPDGNFTWVKSAYGLSGDNPQIALTADNYIYLSGINLSGISFDGTYLPGICCNRASPFIAKYDSDGNFEWAKQGFTNWSDEGGVVKDIKADHEGNLYLTGIYFTCYGSGCTQLDFYVEKYDKNGTHLWREEMNMMHTNDMSYNIDIDNNGFCYALGNNSSVNFIDMSQYSPTNTVGIGSFDTGASTYKRTPRPHGLARTYWLCDETTVALNATGNNIKWYSDPTISKLIHTGNAFEPTLVGTDTFYVTQTFNGIESWPKEIIINIVHLPTASLVLKNNTLSAPVGQQLNYQWLYKGDSINAHSTYVMVDTATSVEDFSVIISQGPCFKLLENIVTAIQPESMRHFSYYPNPTSGVVTIKRADSSRVTFQVLTPQGLEVLRQQGESHTNADVVDISQLPAGIYLLRIQTDDARQTVKLIKK